MSMESRFEGLFGLPFRQIIALLNDKDEEVRHAGSQSVADFFEPIRDAMPQIVELLRASKQGELAKHYKHHKHIAYNSLNEPTDGKHTHVIAFYDAVHTAIRSVDPDHAIFFDGNTFASDFPHFGDAHERWNNTAYSIHDYSSFGFPGAQEYVGSDGQKWRLRRSYEKKREWMDKRGLCVCNGELGLVYARRQYDGDATDAINKTRYTVLKDQLDIYKKVHLSMTFSIPTLLTRAIHTTGPAQLIHLAQQRHRPPRNGPPLPLNTLHFCAFLAKKHRLAINAWSSSLSPSLTQIYDPLIEHIQCEVPERFQTYTPTAYGPSSDTSQDCLGTSSSRSS
ncbi:hypothetical protein GALMADRAFT_148107 [Galerina marginata CBS 339.88]|uniref:Glycoside hydrolase family 5 domain-containing protein n=1 Tax=Galerina marginata (strain CBS 339.88) TaxID=685588 RepID=A0A067SHF8_GALM3|nr:hypothetical protein GALMADRAFT_148107 [Galerina marginata CBS 339.88]